MSQYLSTGNEAVFCLLTKKKLHYDVRADFHSYIGMYLCPFIRLLKFLSVSSAAYITDCETYTQALSNSQASTHSGKLALACGTCFVVSRITLIAVAALKWLGYSMMCEQDIKCFILEKSSGFVRGSATVIIAQFLSASKNTRAQNPEQRPE